MAYMEQRPSSFEPKHPSPTMNISKSFNDALGLSRIEGLGPKGTGVRGLRDERSPAPSQTPKF